MRCFGLDRDSELAQSVRERRESKGGKYRAHQTSHRVALCHFTGRNRSDGCGRPSSVVDLGRLCDLRRFVGWFCDMVQRPPMISRDAGGDQFVHSLFVADRC
jgi:hypothetical protein